jgi:cyanuric acid amidohydrolase
MTQRHSADDHRPTGDALDIGGVVDVRGDCGVSARAHVVPEHRARLRAVMMKCAPDRGVEIRGHPHTMLDHTDISDQRHVRGAVDGQLAGVIGGARIFPSGGAELRGPDGGGLIADIADSTPAA